MHKPITGIIVQKTDTYLVPSSRVRLLVIAMIIFLQASRSLSEPHSSASVQFVMALMSSSQRARGLPLFLEPPPIPSIIDFSKLFSLRMICPKYDNCCFFINVSNGLVALISSITDLLVRLVVHGIHSSLLQQTSTTTQSCQFFFSLLFLSSRIHNHTALLGKLLHLLFCILL